jgi:hypothetical protein
MRHPLMVQVIKDDFARKPLPFLQTMKVCWNLTDSWELYPSPNETILRSVKVIGDKVYTGGYMEFGYWTRQKR